MRYKLSECHVTASLCVTNKKAEMFLIYFLGSKNHQQRSNLRKCL